MPVNKRFNAILYSNELKRYLWNVLKSHLSRERTDNVWPLFEIFLEKTQVFVHVYVYTPFNSDFWKSVWAIWRHSEINKRHGTWVIVLNMQTANIFIFKSLSLFCIQFLQENTSFSWWSIYHVHVPHHPNITQLSKLIFTIVLLSSHYKDSSPVTYPKCLMSETECKTTTWPPYRFLTTWRVLMAQMT